MRIDDGVKREVLAKTDIGEYIGQFVTLRKRGNSLVGLSPFHTEKSPSFYVHPDQGFFKCFGCDASGDVISFLRKSENLSFPDALRVLAKRSGIALEAEDPASARVRSEKEAIYAANEIAASYFHRLLVLDSAGKPARAYCESRGLYRAVIDTFKLGYAPDRWDGLVNELRANGVDLALAAKAGLVKLGQSSYYDVYRDRLIIPTYAVTGEVIAFGGRALGDVQPKYLNTATTPVYTKGRYLYALNAARKAAGKADAIIVVEGYLDCIALHAAGFANTVAALGTAFTPDQARELHKITPNVFVCFDADAAGQAATAKSIDTLLAAGCRARIVALPPGEDPDSFVRANGAPAFAALLERAQPWLEFRIDREVDALRTGFTGAAEIAQRAEALVRNAPREEWDRWRVYIAGRLNLSVDDLRKSRLLTNAGHFAPRTPGDAPRDVRRAVMAAVDLPSFERDVLAIVFEEPRLLAEYAPRIAPERFAHAALRRMYETLTAHRGELVQPSDVRALLSDDEEGSAVFAAIAGSERSMTVRFADSDERRAHLDRVLARFALDDARRRYRDVSTTVDRLIEAGHAIPSELRDELNALAAKLKG